MTAPGRGRSRGLTLIELSFALAIVAAARLGIAGMFPAALRTLFAGGRETQATALAWGLVDRLGRESVHRLGMEAPTGYNGLPTASLSPIGPVAPPGRSAPRVDRPPPSASGIMIAAPNPIC